MNQPDTLCQEGLRAPTPSADDDALTPEVGRLCRLLRQAPMFRSLGCDEIARFARGVREIKAAKGEILFHRGDACHLYTTEAADDMKCVEMGGRRLIKIKKQTITYDRI